MLKGNYNPNSDEAKKEIENTEAGRGTSSGAYEVKITRASIEESNDGTKRFFTLEVESPNGKTWKQQSKPIEEDDVDAEGNPVVKNSFWHGQFMSLVAITGCDTSKMESLEFEENEWNKDAQQFETVRNQYPCFTDMIGKTIGLVVDFTQKPNSKGINGYTGQPIAKRGEDEQQYLIDKENPETIWMPNEEVEPRLNIAFVMFYDIVTGKTASELNDNECVEPKLVAEKVAFLQDKDRSLKQMSAQEWDKMRESLLKKNLKKFNIAYDMKKFIPSMRSSNAGSGSSNSATDIL